MSDYDTRIKENLEPDAYVFMRRNSCGIVVDNSYWHAFSRVLYSIDNYYNMNCLGSDDELLKAIKMWYYKISDSLFKDFVFQWRKSEYFASKVSMSELKKRQH